MLTRLRLPAKLPCVQFVTGILNIIFLSDMKIGPRPVPLYETTEPL